MNEFTIPLRTTTGLNAREHHFVRARRVRAERMQTYGCLCVHVAPKAKQDLLEHLATANSVRVTLTRVSPKAVWKPKKQCWEACDDDGAIGGLKGVRDEVAKWLGLDDGDDRIVFAYGQDKGRELCVRVRIEALVEEVAA